MERVRALILLSFAVVLSSCSGPSTPGRMPAEETRRKLMSYQRVRFSERQFFVGLASGPAVDAATSESYRQIARQLTWLPSGSQDVLSGMIRVEQKAADDEGNVHVLAVLEREAAASHLSKLAREQETEAKRGLQICEKQLEAGEVSGAEACLASVKKTIEQTRALFTAARAAVGDNAPLVYIEPEEKAAKLARRIEGARIQRRSVLIHVLEHLDGRLVGDVDAEFAAVLMEHRLKQVQADVEAAAVLAAVAGRAGGALRLAKERDAGYLLLGNVEARFSSEVSGQFFSVAKGIVRMIETEGGRVVAEASCSDVKGGHVSREQANQKAAKEAVAELRRQLAGRLGSLPPPTESRP